MKELFIKKHPNLVKEIHPDKNNGIDFSVLFENSSCMVEWQCQVNPKHVWKQKIGVRATKGYGCPYCSGRLTLPEESFPVLFPTLLKELHPTKNIDFDPYKYRPGSNKKVWWLCANGHEWQQQIHHRVSRGSTCPKCRKISNSLGKKYPDISKEWHFEKNAPLNPFDVGPSSTKKVWWKCSKNSEHEWEVNINTRTFKGSSCPKCKEKTYKNKPLPALSEYSTKLSNEWHPTNNGNLKPSDVTAGSTQKVWWRCSNDPSHEWQAVIRNRARQGKGCPKCAKRTKSNPTNSLYIRYPEIAKQWHPTKNNNIALNEVSYGSSYLAWWLCPKNPSHEWQATVVSRTQRNSTGCPKCPESRKSRDNSLAIVHPDIAAQWHPTKNKELTPDKVSRASGRKIWWICSNNPDHEWEAQIKNRTVLGSGCPFCFQELNAIRLTEHLYDLTSSDIDAYHILLSNLRVLKKLLDLEIKSHARLNQPYLRMLYTSAITYLETYLADTFCNEVLHSGDLIEKVITTNPELNKKQYSIAEVFDWNKNITKKLSEYLFSIMWHNLAKVEKLYNNTLEVSFPRDITDLYQAINIRHDIVHRNGRTKSGRIRHIKKANVENLILKIRDFADHINTKLTEIKTEQSATQGPTNSAGL